MAETTSAPDFVPDSTSAPASQPSHSGGRIPPQDLEAEKSLLGALLLSGENFATILETVQSEDFYDPRHARIYRGMEALFEHHRSIDLMTLTSELRNQRSSKKSVAPLISPIFPILSLLLPISKPMRN